MGLFGFGKKKKEKRTTKRTVQQSIPYTQVYDNGVIETSPGVFTKAYRLEDVNFKIAQPEEQMDIFKAYGQLINTFPEKSRFQILVQNKAADRRQFLKEIRFEPQKDGMNKYRSEMNRILMDKVAESSHNLMQEKFCIVSIEDESVESAMRTLSTLDKDIDKALRRILGGGRTVPLTLTERLHSLFDFYNQDGQSVFDNVRKSDGTTTFDLKTFYRQGNTSKDAIAPGGMWFKANHFILGECFGRSMFLEKVPARLTTEFMADLADVPHSMTISLQYEPVEQTKSMKLVRSQLTNLNAQIAEAQKRAGEQGYSTEVISPELYRAQQQATDLMDDMVSRDQKLYYVTMVVTVFGDNLDQLKAATQQVTSVAKQHNAPLQTLLYLQERGMNACLPLCVNDLKVRKLLTTESASVFLPYTSQEIYQKNGIYYGTNQTTGSMIVYSRKTAKNFNGLIFGESGSGKSFAAKSEMLSVVLRDPDSQVFIIDPEEEYTPMVQALKGEVIDLSSNSRTFVNPLDMDIDYDGEGDPLMMKSDYIVSMLEIMCGRGRVILPKERSVIDRCVRNIYRGYLQHLEDLRKTGVALTLDRDSMPTLTHLYNELKLQSDEDAQEIANILEIYATGSLTTFAHRSNVDTNAQVVSYNIRNLGAGMKNLGLFVCLNDVWNKMIENRKKGRWTWIYIDEFYLLLRSESASAFLMEVWKRARKWNGVPTGIMQNTEDLLRSVDARNIINNTSFIQMLGLPKFDRDNLADLLGISDTQLEYINNPDRGTGLIYNQKTILPFNNEYPRDSMLYGLMSTSQAQDAVLRQ